MVSLLIEVMSTNPDSRVCPSSVQNNRRNLNTPGPILNPINVTTIGHRPQCAGERADGPSTPPHICPDSSAWPCEPQSTVSFPTVPAHPTVPSNLPLGRGPTSDTGILHVALSDAPYIKLHYWVTTRSVLSEFHLDRLTNGYDTFAFTPFSSEMAWLRLTPISAITSTISPSYSKTAPPKINSYSVSKSLSPPALPNPPLTAPVDQMTALINLMLQQIQQNVGMMVQLYHQASPRSYQHRLLRP